MATLQIKVESLDLGFTEPCFRVTLGAHQCVSRDRNRAIARVVSEFRLLRGLRRALRRAECL